MGFEDLLKRAIKVREQYDELNATRGAHWNAQDFMAGFVGDVGDLSKIIMAKNGLREMENIDEKLAHELVDCLWSVLVIAEKYDINLVSEFQKTMEELEIRITKDKARY